MQGVTVEIDGLKEIERMVSNVGGKARRAAAAALTKTGVMIKEAEMKEMKSVFSNPVPYTLNSLKLSPARADDLEATVWFKEPDRMGQHYLVPQVEGGSRKLKGFERALGMGELVPGKFARTTARGNISKGQIVQLLSVFGMAQQTAGYSANQTAASLKRNKRAREYVILPTKHSKLWPGVYERVTVRASKKRQRYHANIKYKKRGLRPVLLKGKTGHSVKPLLKDFYSIAAKVEATEFGPLFWKTFYNYIEG